MSPVLAQLSWICASLSYLWVAEEGPAPECVILSVLFYFCASVSVLTLWPFSFPSFELPFVKFVLFKPSQSFFCWLVEATGWIVSSFHELKGEGEVSMLHLSQVRFGLLIPSQRPQFCQEWISENQAFLVCCLTAPCRQRSSLGGRSAPLTPCIGWTVISVMD